MLHTLNLVPDSLMNVITIAIIICVFFDKSGYIDVPRNRLFQRSVYLSLININLHIAVLLCISNADKLNRSLITALMMTSFILSGILALLVYSYIIIDLHSFSPSIYCKVSLALRFSMTAIYILLVLLNLKTAWIFSWDSAGKLVEGKLYLIALILYVAHFLIMFVEFIIFNKRGPYAFYRLALIATPVCAGATIIQLLFPKISLNATYGALAVFVIFISVQQNVNEIDAMTSAYTRPVLIAFLNLCIQKREPFCILAIKIDQFQQINMRFGPEKGDIFLNAIAKILRQIQPKHVYRMKGATFALVFPNCSEEEYHRKLSEIKGKFNKPWKISANSEIVMDVAFADLAWKGDTHKNANMILSNIEYALGIAKLDREKRYLRFDKSMQEAYNRREHILNRLKIAMEETNAFRFCFQPIFAVKEGSDANKWENFPFVCVGAEALLRLNDADGTPLSPEKFIPIAESSGLIYDITYMTLRMACVFLKKQRLPESWFLALNISAHQFINKKFIRAVINALKEYSITPARIKLEITEYSSLFNEESAIENILTLNQYGIEVFLDDFGTGYSNLFTASHLPINCVKIDRSLIQDIQLGTPAHGLLEAFVVGFNKFNIHSLAEGIEEEWQLKVAYEMGIAMAQGFYLSRPLEETDFIRLIETHLSMESQKKSLA